MNEAVISGEQQRFPMPVALQRALGHLEQVGLRRLREENYVQLH